MSKIVIIPVDDGSANNEYCSVCGDYNVVIVISATKRRKISLGEMISEGKSRIYDAVESVIAKHDSELQGELMKDEASQNSALWGWGHVVY